MWFFLFSSRSFLTDGWTAKEKAGYLAFEGKCPKEECLAVFWHPDIRAAIVETPLGLTSASFVIDPESRPYLNLQAVPEGWLSSNFKDALLILPDDADRIPLIREDSTPPPLGYDELFERLRQCAPFAEERGVNGRYLTISLDGLMDALAQGRTIDDFFTDSQYQCLRDLHEMGYYISFGNYMPIPAL